MEPEKHPLDFISLSRGNHPPGSHLKKNKINYRVILNNLPIPISVWEKVNEEFRLVYLNHSAKEKLQPELRLSALMSAALPEDYSKYISKGRLPGNFSGLIGNNLIAVYHYKDNDLFINQSAGQENNYLETIRKMVGPIPFSVIITDCEGNIEYVNPKFVEVTGYTLEEVTGKNPRLLKSGKMPPEEYKKMWDTISSGKVWKGEFINKRKNGEIYYEYGVIIPIKNKSGRITHYYSSKEDITRLKEAERELLQAENFAALGKMAAYISHEIKTPLTSIKLNVDLLEQNCPADSDQKKSFTILQKEMKRLNNLLKNVLQFSKDASYYFSKINLYKKIESIHEFIKPLLAEHGITLLNNTDGSYIYGDPQQLRSLFIHLLENSIESINNNGEIEISSKTEGAECHVFIKDSGCGISNIKDIFEPFYSTKASGTGLGLPIAKNIAEKHKGILQLVSSKPGETIFEIILPAGG